MNDATQKSELESWVLGVCQDLGLPIRSPDDDFFEVGGTSLSALKLISRAEEQFGEDALLPDDVFERSIIREIAASIESRQSER